MKQPTQKTLLLVISAISSVFLLTQSGVANALMAFLLVGALPGTSYSLPAGAMLLIIALIVWLLIFRMTAVSLISFLQIDRLAKKRLQQKSQLPKRRFGQI